MTDCEVLCADAPGLVSLHADDPDRLAAFAHAASCRGCARALREAERLHVVRAELGPSAAPVVALAGTAQAIGRELVRERRRRSGWAAIAAAVVTAILVGFAGHRGGSGPDRVVAFALAAAGVALSALSATIPVGALTGAAVAAGAAALIAGREGPLEAETGVWCVLAELACAGVVVWTGWLALRGGTTRHARSAVAAAAAAGALAGAGALQITCSAHESALHLLVFHAGGVVLAATLAALIWRPRVVGV